MIGADSGQAQKKYRAAVFKKNNNSPVSSLLCGMDGTRTRDPLRDRQVF